MAPIQLRVLPIANRNTDVFEFCRKLQAKAKALGIRVDLDVSGDRLPNMIRKAEMDKIPVTAVIGAKEVNEGTAAIRIHKRGQLTQPVLIDELLNELKTSIEKYADAFRLSDQAKDNSKLK